MRGRGLIAALSWLIGVGAVAVLAVPQTHSWSAVSEVGEPAVFACGIWLLVSGAAAVACVLASRWLPRPLHILQLAALAGGSVLVMSPIFVWPWALLLAEVGVEPAWPGLAAFGVVIVGALLCIGGAATAILTQAAALRADAQRREESLAAPPALRP